MSFFRGDEGHARLRQLALKTRDLPYDQHSYNLFENRDAAHEAGVDPQALQAFDPTDEALDAVLAQANSQPDRPLLLANFGGPSRDPEGLPPRNRTGGYLYPPPTGQKRLKTMPGPPGVDIDANIREADPPGNRAGTIRHPLVREKKT